MMKVLDLLFWIYSFYPEIRLFSAVKYLVGNTTAWIRIQAQLKTQIRVCLLGIAAKFTYYGYLITPFKNSEFQECNLFETSLT